MKFDHVPLILSILFIQTAFTRCQRRMSRQNAVMAALQNMIAPPCDERPPSMPMPNYIPNNMPTVMPMQAQTLMSSQVPLPWQMPQMSLAPQMATPLDMSSQLPMPMGLLNPRQYEDIVPITPSRIVQREIIPNVRYVEPKCSCQEAYKMPEFVSRNVQAVAEIPMPQLPVVEKIACPCSCASPAPLVSPFLPAASPVSPWAPPTSNLLPPVIPNQTRSHFLRKIPIPPPTL